MPPGPVDVDGHAEYYVDKILKMSGKGDQAMYLVKWEGYSLEDATWEPYEHVKDSKALHVWEKEEYIRRQASGRTNRSLSLLQEGIADEDQES